MRQPTPRTVVRQAVREALGLPSLVLLASMTGFGSLARESGFDLGVALAATAGIWGLPGQIALAELYAAGAETAAIAMAVSLANARFLPMAVSFMPLLRPGLDRQRWLYLLVQLLSVNTWAAGMRVCPRLPAPLRHLFYGVFALVVLIAALTGTAAGFFATAALPRPVSLGLVFLNPVFFALLFAGMRGRQVALALAAGALIGPLSHLVWPDWSVLVAGLVGGSGAFWLARALPAERARR